MALDEILSEIEERRKARLSDLKQEYDRKNGELVISTQKRIDAMRQEFQSSLAAEVTNLRSRENSLIELNANRIIDDRKKELIHSALQKVMESSDKLRKSKDYPKILKKMADESRKILGKTCRIYVFKEDMELLVGEDVSELKSQKRIRGGLLGVSSDGKMELDLTFDTIFQSERENIESILAEKIKGD